MISSRIWKPFSRAVAFGLLLLPGAFHFLAACSRRRPIQEGAFRLSAASGQPLTAISRADATVFFHRSIKGTSAR